MRDMIDVLLIALGVALALGLISLILTVTSRDDEGGIDR